MIISHKYKYIFLKTNKTAGTSIEIALSKYCDENDVITPLTPEDEIMRQEFGGIGPQNYLLPLRKYNFHDLTTLLLQGERKQRFYNHISAREIKSQINNDMWNSYYKFCFERNPWDRIISLYYWRYKQEPRPSISEFLESQAPIALKRKGSDIYTIDGDVVVDRICKYENITDELEAVRKALGIGDSLTLPSAKSKFRKDKRSYRDILNNEDRDRISEIFRDEISLLGYEF